MARLPIIEPSAQVTPALQTARADVRGIERSGDDAYRGLMSFANSGFDVAEKLKGARDAADATRAISDYSTELDKYRIELDKDGDHATKAERFQRFAQEKLQDRIKGLDRRAADLLIARFTPVAQAMEQTVRAGSRKDEIQDGVTKIRASNEALLAQAHAARSDVEREVYLTQIKANIDTGLQTGLFNAAGHRDETRQTLAKADQAYVLRLIAQNPGAVPALLDDPKRFTNLDPVQRERLKDAARDEGRKNTSLALQMADREERRQDRVLRKAGDEADKSIAAMERDGTLTREGIEAMRPYLSANDYRAALRLLAGGAAVDDKDAVNRIAPELHRRDVKRDLQELLTQGKLTTTTYRTMINANEAALKDDQPASPFKRGREYVAATLDPGSLLSGPAAAVARAGRAEALTEFDNWAQRNREAPVEAYLQEAQATVQRYALIQYDRMSTAIGLPRFVDPNVTRESIDAAQVKAAGERAHQAYRAGQLDRAGYQQELRKLEAWDEIIKKKPAPAPAQPGRR